MPWSRELSTGAALRPAAAYPLADLLSEWLTEVASNFVAPERAHRAAERLTGWWNAATVADVTVRACRAYARDRAASPATIRRELVSVLVSALSHAVRSERLAGTERPFVWRPPGAATAPARWLTRVYRLVGEPGPAAPRLRADGTVWDPNRLCGFEPRRP